MTNQPPGRKATKRVPVTEETFERLRQFTRGADMDYSKLIDALLDTIVKPGEDVLIAGRRFGQAESKRGAGSNAQ